MDQRRESRLKAIPGAPPNIVTELQGCPFAPRCEFVLEKCWTERPLLQPVSPTQKVACFVNPYTKELRANPGETR